MAERCFEIDLPEEILTSFGWTEAEVPHKIREALIMELLRLDRLSEAEGAELLKLDRWEFLEVMGRSRVPAIRMSSQELHQELAREIT